MTSRWDRVVLEVKREATRGAVLGFIAVYLLAAAGFALVSAGSFTHEYYLDAAYVFLPLVFAPYAARLATRDRERGYHTIATVNPLTRAEETLSRVAFLGIMVIITLGLTAPITIAIAPPGAHAFEQRALLLLAWGFLVAITSVIAGLVIGSVAIDRGALAVGIAAGWSFLQLFIAENMRNLLGLGIPSWGASILHADPALWSLEATSPEYEYMSTFHVPPILGAFLTLCVFLVMFAFVLRLQDRQGWRPLNSRRGVEAAGFAFLLVLLMGGVVAAAPALSTSSTAPINYFVGHYASYHDGNITLTWTNQAGQLLFTRNRDAPLTVNLLEGERAVGVLVFQGKPNSTVRLANLSLESYTMDPGPVPPLNDTLQLNSDGVGILRLPVRPVPVIISNGPVAPIAFKLDVDGQRSVVAGYFDYASENSVDLAFVPHWPIVATAGLLPAIAFGPLAILLPRRLNRW